MNGTIDCYCREVKSKPESRNAFLHLGSALHEQGMFEEAVAVYDRAIAMWPEFGEAHNNRGNALLEMGSFRDAIDSYRSAICLLPSFAEGYVTIATALQALHKPYEAMASCYRALAIDAQCAEAHWNLALALLQVGEYTTGWEEFEWRWKKKGFTSRRRSFQQPMWNGEYLAGRTILIHAEQGFGDTIQFVRFLPLVAGRGGRVLLECPAPLKRLMQEVPGVDCVVSSGEEDIPPFDVHLPVMSLARIFNSVPEGLPGEVPYVFPPVGVMAAWLKRVGTGTGFRIGLVWAGRKKPDPNRTCPLENLSPLARIPGVTFYSLQVGENISVEATANTGLRLTDLTADIRDFADTSALIAQLDLVISIDTAVAHLAGAMGKETWVILPHAADWRWMLDRHDSPWYPTMRLFRQEKPGDWQQVIKNLCEELRLKLSAACKDLAFSSPEVETIYSLGLAGLRNGNLAEAKRHLCRALIINPHIPEVYNALGVLCREAGDMDNARLFFDHTIKMDPVFADGYINMGNVFYNEDLLGEAAAAYRQAIKVAPNDVRAHQNLGVVLQAEGLLSEAETSFRSALSLDPGYATARWNMAVLKLLKGELKEGFTEFESRFDKSDPVPAFHRDKTLWDGSTFHGKTLLVHAEQGFGDTFQFIRYIPMAADRGGRVIFECQDKSLRMLLESVVDNGNLFVRGDCLPCFDLQVPLLSLPRIFETTGDTIPATVPYLSPSNEKVAAWKRKIEAYKEFRAGLVWGGRAKPDPKRSAFLTDLAPLANIPGVIFYSLQIGNGSEQALSPPNGMVLRDFTDLLTDFSETAALIANLDLVITIDSAVAHLAGAMGKDVWVMLPYAPDWRWMIERNESPWYPTMRLFRQTAPGDWQGVAGEIARELGEVSRKHSEAEKFHYGQRNINPAGMIASLAENGFEWMVNGNLAQAEFCFRKVLAIAPDFTPAKSGLAQTLAARGENGEAEKLFSEVLAGDPENVKALAGLGNIYSKRGRHGNALEKLRLAHEAEPENIDVMFFLAEELSFNGRQEESVVLFEKVVAKMPECMKARLNLGVVLTYLKRYDEAARAFECCIEKSPGDPRAYNLLGIVRQKENRIEEASVCFRKAMETDPGYLHAANNYGSVLSSLGRTDMAAVEFRKALDLDPRYHDARWNLCLACLRMGDYSEGWRHYDSRWEKSNPVERRMFPFAEWDGEPIPGETLLIYCEQGYGDTFQFIRLVETVKPLCGRLVVECQSSAITGLVATARGVDAVIVRGESPAAVHKYRSLLDLPCLTGLTPETIPSGTPYLHADPDLTVQWKNKLNNKRFPKVGLVWAGRPDHEDDRNRSIPFNKLERLLDIRGIQFISLQVGPAASVLKSRENERFTDLSAEISSYDDTAAIIENLELVLSVDTSVAHLAGALAKQVWVMLPFSPDWRWMEERSDSPWYPTMRLYRQPNRGDWEDVIARVSCDLREIFNLSDSR
jgi:tetratricopeptide (TPR) repeat protein